MLGKEEDIKWKYSEFQLTKQIIVTYRTGVKWQEFVVLTSLTISSHLWKGAFVSEGQDLA